MHIILALIYSSIILFLAGCASKEIKQPDWQIKCGDLNSVKDGKYCLHVKGKPKSTIWYFHGLGCDQNLFKGTGCLIPKSGKSEQELMRSLDDVMLITVSFGKSWLLDPVHPKTMAEKDATVKNFIEKIVPELQSFHSPPQPFIGIGHSMGGFNVAQICMSHPEFFKKCIIMHPMIPACKLYTGEILNEKCLPDELISREIPEQKWPQVDPLQRIREVQAITPSKVLVCEQDDFGLIAGPKQFGISAILRGLPVVVESYGSCNHYEWPVKKVLEDLSSN